jgi:hypothetical protein
MQAGPGVSHPFDGSSAKAHASNSATVSTQNELYEMVARHSCRVDGRIVKLLQAIVAS